MADHIKLVSWNVNGIRAVIKKGAFSRMLEALDPDILCLQETKAEQGQVEIDLPHYEEYWNSASKKGYSGTAIFTKIKPRAVYFDYAPAITNAYTLHDAYGDLTAEGRVVTLEFEKFYVVTVYTPNAKPDLSRLSTRFMHWDPAFLAHVSALQKKKPVLFCGDLNVAHTADDLARPKENEGEHGFTKEERKGVDALIDAGFVDAFRLFHQGNGHYSWWSYFGNARSRNIGWRIDYWFVSDTIADQVSECTIHPHLLGSDHCPVSLVWSP
jgi:exodeoxyribonuclease III